MMLRVKSICVYHANGNTCFEDHEDNPEGARHLFVDTSEPGNTGLFVHVLENGKMPEKPTKIMTFIGCAIVIETLAVIGLPNKGKNKQK